MIGRSTKKPTGRTTLPDEEEDWVYKKPVSKKKVIKKKPKPKPKKKVKR